jgi:hypothetical protein
VFAVDVRRLAVGFRVFKVGANKPFAMTAERDGARELTTKLTDDEREVAMQLPHVRRASYVGRYGWVTVTVTDEESLQSALGTRALYARGGGRVSSRLASGAPDDEHRERWLLMKISRLGAKAFQKRHADSSQSASVTEALDGPSRSRRTSVARALRCLAPFGAEFAAVLGRSARFDTALSPPRCGAWHRRGPLDSECET